MTSSKVCLIIGVGPGTGSALVRKFVTSGYQVAMLARDVPRLARLSSETGVHAFPCDVTDVKALDVMLEKVRGSLGSPSVVVHNAVGGLLATFSRSIPQIWSATFE